MDCEVEKTKRKKLTYKQKRFVDEYIASGGNGTRAALTVYNVGGKHGTDNPERTAQNIASENLSRPIIQQAIDAKTRVKGLCSTFVVNKLMQDCEDDMREYSPAVRTKSLELLAKYLRMFEEQAQGTETFQSIAWGKGETDKAGEK